jgi:hypothetical protein
VGCSVSPNAPSGRQQQFAFSPIIGIFRLCFHNNTTALMNDLSNFSRAKTFNHHFVAPEGWSTASPDDDCPVFSADWRTVLDALREVALSERRTHVMDNDLVHRRIQFCQRSRVFRFPDDIQVEAIPLSDFSTKLAIYSKSRYGVRDFGVNQRRVKRWLASLERRVPLA